MLVNGKRIKYDRKSSGQVAVFIFIWVIYEITYIILVKQSDSVGGNNF